MINNVFMAEDLTIGGAVRTSDCETVGTTTTWQVNASWTPAEDIRLRAPCSEAIGAPDIGELFRPLSRTFANFADPCSDDVIRSDPSVAENRVLNCAAPGVPVGFLDDNPNLSKPGFLGGNVHVREKQSESFTIDAIIQPCRLPNLSIVINRFDIKITDAVAGLGPAMIAGNISTFDQTGRRFFVGVRASFQGSRRATKCEGSPWGGPSFFGTGKFPCTASGQLEFDCL